MVACVLEINPTVTAAAAPSLLSDFFLSPLRAMSSATEAATTSRTYGSSILNAVAG